MAKPKITLPEAPLLDRGLLLDQIARFDAPDLRWVNEGVTWQPRTCSRTFETIRAHNGACADDFFEDDTVVNLCEAWVEQAAFTFKDRLGGSNLELVTGELEGLLAERWREMVSWVFADMLTSIVAGVETLPSAASAPAGIAFGSAATPLYNALANLEAELSNRQFSRSGTIFLPPGMVGNAIDMYGVEWRDGHWRTPVGNVVVVDPGFVDADAPTGQTASAAGEEWIYASGPVYYQSTAPRFSEVRRDGVGSRDRNLITAFGDSFGIFIFDPCPVTAVLVSYSPE